METKNKLKANLRQFARYGYRILRIDLLRTWSKLEWDFRLDSVDNITYLQIHDFVPSKNSSDPPIKLINTATCLNSIELDKKRILSSLGLGFPREKTYARF